MNLVIDAGNTRIKWALFRSGDLSETGTAGSWEDFEQAAWRTYVLEIENCIVSSTRVLRQDLRDLFGGHTAFFVLSHQLPLPLKIVYLTPETLGLDRIAGASGAVSAYPGENILLIDIGTAITCDLISADGCFMGGNISPGAGIRFKGLHESTGHLPLVGLSDQWAEFGQSTVEALQAGVQNGILYELMGYINLLNSKYKDLRVILTGGDAEYFAKKIKKTIFVDQNLVLKGLNHILEYQSRNKDGL